MSTTTGTIQHLSPAELTIEANVRSSAPLTAEFIASIRENGVITPVLARRDENGTVIVRAGQRRTLAAREAGTATIPVYIIDADEKTAGRIVQQIVENEHRENLPDAQLAAAYQQLAFEGMTPATIAKRTGTKTATVKTGLEVAKNDTASAAIATHSLTLVQAATLIEFEGDEDTVARLIDTATTDPGQFAHATQRARDERRMNAIKADATADLTAAGFTILDRQPGYYDTDVVNISELVTTDGQRVTPEDIADAPGRSAFVRVFFTGDEAAISYYLSDYKAAGFRKDTGSGAASGPMTEEQKAERKTLIANNKAWASAETVRREWLTQLLSRKTLPKDTARMIATGLTVHRHAVGDAATTGNQLAHTLLGIPASSYQTGDTLTGLLEHSPAKAQHITLAVILGGIEDSTSKNTWRYPEARKASYFSQLAAWGYTLSEVEQIVIDAAATTPTTTEPDTEADDGEYEDEDEGEDLADE